MVRVTVRCVESSNQEHVVDTYLYIYIYTYIVMDVYLGAADKKSVALDPQTLDPQTLDPQVSTEPDPKSVARAR